MQARSPVLLTPSQPHRYTLTGKPAFDEGTAVAEIEAFINHPWSDSHAPAKVHIFSSLPTILAYAIGGTYARAMQSEQEMTDFVENLTRQFDDAANMDW